MSQSDFRKLALDNGKQSLETGSSIVLPDEAATEAIGKQLSGIVKVPNVIFLEGELGAGKTTLIRGFLRGLGYQGIVKSPTFTLVESYEFEKGRVYHFDLYRLNVPEELELMGIRDYFTEDAIVLVEWPERGLGFLPRADLILALSLVPEGRVLNMHKKG
jgi:tRNA threonylcarbamoyladenosine biosynthesis protein TsaE